MIDTFDKVQLPSVERILTFSLVMIITSIVAYHYVDRSVAEWTYYNSRTSPLHFLWQYATYIQPIYYIISPWLTFYIMFSFVQRKPLAQWHKIVLIMLFSMSITILCNEQLRVIFGRLWPSTWFHGNLSWISDRAYGFTWFKMQHEFKSFPSGHTSLMFGLMMPLYWLVPSFKMRLFALGNCFLVAVGLILMCYHFVSDVIAAALVGTVTAYLILYGLKCCNELRNDHDEVRK